MKATAAAHPNIALVKYWGKRDERLLLPFTGSLSMTLGGLSATTTVEFADRKSDEAEIDGRTLAGKELARIADTLDLVRAQAHLERRAKVVSKTDFPNAAGLASSAAGGAALALAASRAAGLKLSVPELSILARRNSGSACRSIEGGFCEWKAGSAADGSDSFAVQVAPASHWPELRMLVCVCADEAKETSSRDGMRLTVETSPFYAGWMKAVEIDLPAAREALLAKDFTTLGLVAERNAWRMHASSMAADPPLVYMRPTTLAVIEAVKALRGKGTESYFTLDAGPNPVVLCRAPDVKAVEAAVRAIAGVQRTVEAAPGDDAKLVDRNLF